MLTPDGVTYENDYIVKCLEKKKQDPVSRNYLHEDQLIPNLTLDFAIEEFSNR